jgi:hypothetical protein
VASHDAHHIGAGALYPAPDAESRPDGQDHDGDDEWSGITAAPPTPPASDRWGVPDDLRSTFEPDQDLADEDAPSPRSQDGDGLRQASRERDLTSLPEWADSALAVALAGDAAASIPRPVRVYGASIASRGSWTMTLVCRVKGPRAAGS